MFSQIAELWNCAPETAVMRLLLEEKAAVGAVYFSLSDEDVAAILSSDQVSVGSDGAGMKAEDDFGKSTHPALLRDICQNTGCPYTGRGNPLHGKSHSQNDRTGCGTPGIKEPRFDQARVHG